MISAAAVKKEKEAGRFAKYMVRNRATDNNYLLKRDIARIGTGIFTTILLFGLCFLILQPLFHQFSNSIMSRDDLFDPTVLAIPRVATFDNYRLAGQLMSYWTSLFNSVWITALVAVLQIAACTLVAYGFARFEFPLKRFWFACVILTILVPPQVIRSPLFLNFHFFDFFGLVTLFQEPLRLTNTMSGYVVLSATAMGLRNGLYIFMLRQYFRNMPKELEESAWVDGCGKLRTFLQIMLPDAVPMLVSCFLFAFVWQWTDGFFTSMFLREYGVMAVQMNGLGDAFNFHFIREVSASMGTQGSAPPMALLQAMISTGVLIGIAPVIAIYLFAQRYFVESIGQSGIKM
jgi:multiple sugar transport system permease protein